MDEALRQRIIESMEWMVADMKYRYEETKGIEGTDDIEYSPELRKAIALLEELKNG